MPAKCSKGPALIKVNLLVREISLWNVTGNGWAGSPGKGAGIGLLNEIKFPSLVTISAFGMKFFSLAKFFLL